MGTRCLLHSADMAAQDYAKRETRADRRCRDLDQHRDADLDIYQFGGHRPTWSDSVVQPQWPSEQFGRRPEEAPAPGIALPNLADWDSVLEWCQTWSTDGVFWQSHRYGFVWSPPVG